MLKIAKISAFFLISKLYLNRIRKFQIKHTEISKCLANISRSWTFGQTYTTYFVLIPCMYLQMYAKLIIRVKLWLKTNDWIEQLCSFISRLKIFSFIRNGRLRHFGLSGFKHFLLKANLFKGHFFTMFVSAYESIQI